MTAGAGCLVLLLATGLVAWGAAELVRALGRWFSPPGFPLVLQAVFSALLLSGAWVVLIFALMAASDSGNAGVLLVAAPVLFVAGAGAAVAVDRLRG